MTRKPRNAPAPRRGAPKRASRQRAPKRAAAPGGPTAPVRRPRGPPPSAPKPVLITSFRAEGSIGSLASVIYGGVREFDGPSYEKKQRRYLTLQSGSPKGFPDSPGVWTSIESFALGQVNFPGRVPLSALRAMLSEALNLYRGGRLVDFTRAYPNWKFKYQVVEILTVPRARESAFKRNVPEDVRRRVVERSTGNSRY